MRAQRTLAFKMVWMYILLNSLLLVFFGTVTMLISTDSLEKEVTSYTEKTLEQASIILNNNLTDVRSRVIRLTSDASVRACLNMKRPAYEKTLAYERSIDTLLKEINLFKPIIQDVLILGDNGYVYNLSDRNNLVSDYDYTAQQWYQQARDTEGGVHIRMIGLHAQDFYNPRIEATARYEPTFSMSMAVGNNRREIVGAIVCNFDLQALGNQLMSSNYENSGKIALVDENGVIVSQNDNTRLGENLGLDEAGWARVRDGESGSFQTQLDGHGHLVSFSTPDVQGWKLVSYIPLNEIQNHSMPILYTILPFLALCLACNAAIALAYSRSVGRPVRALIDSISGVDAADLRPVSEQRPYEELTQIAVKFNELLARLDQLIKRDYLTQIELNKFQLSALQSQINPHFLFNTLQLLQTEILYNKLEDSNDIIVSLSRLLRYSMSGGAAEVTVAQEAGYLRDYLSLFIRKYENRLEAVIEVDPRIERCLMPRLLLQPLVENCLTHAFSDGPNASIIGVSARPQGMDLCLSVRDNGCGMPPERLRQVRARLSGGGEAEGEGGIGLCNVHQRIRVLYGERYGLTVDSGAEGTVISLLMPQIRREEEPDGEAVGR